MNIDEIFKKTPWDSTVFGIETYELQSLSKEILEISNRMPGHYTVKVDPLSPKKILHEYGYYYCDTLIEPHCTKERFVFYEKEGVGVSRNVSFDALINICHGAFFYGRFHRDFNLRRDLADCRYDNWVKQLYHSGNVFGLMHLDELVGFFGVSGNKIVLHAVSEKCQGKGLAKYLWSTACMELFNAGYSELISSVSAGNLAVVNLYASLGFRFRNALDIYHRLVE